MQHAQLDLAQCHERAQLRLPPMPVARSDAMEELREVWGGYDIAGEIRVARRIAGQDARAILLQEKSNAMVAF